MSTATIITFDTSTSWVEMAIQSTALDIESLPVGSVSVVSVVYGTLS